MRLYVFRSISRDEAKERGVGRSSSRGVRQRARGLCGRVGEMGWLVRSGIENRGSRIGSAPTIGDESVVYLL